MNDPEYWRDGRFILPRVEHLPVEVEYEDGRREKRTRMEGSWKNVLRWRQL